MKKKHLAYTICFIIKKEKILMLYRKRSPNQHKWNGLGGKIEENETPTENIFREISEEAEFNLKKAKKIYEAGIVTWKNIENEHVSNQAINGMHAFIAYIPEETISWKKKETEEGTLEWKKLSWICDIKNINVVSNIRYFLPSMLKSDKPHHYSCIYRGERLESVKILPTLPDFVQP